MVWGETDTGIKKPLLVVFDTNFQSKYPLLMENKTLINYYIRKGYHQHIQDLCRKQIEKKGPDSGLSFWHAFAFGMAQSYAEGIRELEKLKNKKDVEYACIAALMYMHNHCKLVDHEELAQLEMMQVTAEDRASDSGLLLCATFYWHVKEYKQASSIVNKLVGNGGMTPIQVQATLLKGWIDLTLIPKNKNDAEIRTNSVQYFENVINQQDCETLLGMAKYHEMKKNYAESMNYLDQIIVKYDWFEPALSEKALVLLKSGDWEICIDTAERALSANKYNIEALRLLILYYLSREGHYAEATKLIGNLLTALNKTEASNGMLICSIARANAILADGNRTVLQANLGLIDRAIRSNPEMGNYVAERGYQLSLMEDYSAAIDSYKAAIKIDESNESALHGMIFCQMKQGQLDDAAQQLEFLTVIQESASANADVTFLQALLAWHKDGNRSKQLELLHLTTQIHMDMLKKVVQRGNSNTYDLMVKLNPGFLTQIAAEYLQHAGQNGADGSDGSIDVISRGINILQKVVNKSPGFLRVQLTLASARLANNHLDEASKICNMIVKMDDTHAEAYLLLARIALQRNHHSAASQSLEEALSHDFSIRQRPVYHLIKAKVYEAGGDLEKAKNVLENAMKQYGGNSKINKGPQISMKDKASIYIQLAEVYFLLKDIGKSTDTVKLALSIFRGTAEEVHILVANSELAIKNNDFDAAIKMLNNIPPESPAFVNALMVKANVYLEHRRDKRQYIKCYENLTEKNPTSQNYIQLGDAHLRIQNIVEAIDAYSNALDLNPENFELANKIGYALTTMHDYIGAIDYFRNAVSQAPDRVSLRIELVELYLKVKQYENAIDVIERAPDRDPTDVNMRIEDVKLLLLNARIRIGMQNTQTAVSILQKALEAQRGVLKAIKGDQSDFARKQKRVMAEICFELSKLYANDSEKTVEMHNQALKADPEYLPAIVALARHYLKTSDSEKCKSQCATLLRLDPSNEEGAIMLADIMFQRADYESAIYHFKELLEKKPDNFTALSRFIMMLRRSGKLEDATDVLANAERLGQRVKHSAGFRYCKGIHQWYLNNINEALAEFNLARRDAEWGKEAVMHMVEIYLNPDNENMWDDTEVGTQQGENIRIASKLLSELPNVTNKRIKTLEGYVLVASKVKLNLETACTLFLEQLEEDRDYIPALLGLAIAYMLLNQQAKARNQLKRIAKMHYDQTAAEEFEKSYLLLADIYIERAKFDLAQELCKKALEHNKSCGKAWSTLGLIMEKEQSYQDAAESYEQSWKCEGMASATIGFKLAFNYLKAKRYIETIDVCNKVLSMYPAYPKIKEEILHKAYAAIRP